MHSCCSALNETSASEDVSTSACRNASMKEVHQGPSTTALGAAQSSKAEKLGQKAAAALRNAVMETSALLCCWKHNTQNQTDNNLKT